MIEMWTIVIHVLSLYDEQTPMNPTMWVMIGITIVQCLLGGIDMLDMLLGVRTVFFTFHPLPFLSTLVFMLPLLWFAPDEQGLMAIERIQHPYAYMIMVDILSPFSLCVTAWSTYKNAVDQFNVEITRDAPIARIHFVTTIVPSIAFLGLHLVVDHPNTIIQSELVMVMTLNIILITYFDFLFLSVWETPKMIQRVNDHNYMTLVFNSMGVSAYFMPLDIPNHDLLTFYIVILKAIFLLAAHLPILIILNELDIANTRHDIDDPLHEPLLVKHNDKEDEMPVYV